jgi:hypothetical protein
MPAVGPVLRFILFAKFKGSPLSRLPGSRQPSAGVRVLDPLHAIGSGNAIHEWRQRPRSVHHRLSRWGVSRWLRVHCSSSVWSCLLAVVLHLLEQMMVLSAYSIILLTRDLKLLRNVLELRCLFSLNFDGGFEIADVVRC